MAIFVKRLMPELLSEDLLSFRKGQKQLLLSQADALVQVWKKWALEHGAKKCAYWFQPVRWQNVDTTSFILSPKDSLETAFEGKDLLQKKIDLPSLLPDFSDQEGFLRWDSFSLPFLIEQSQELVLCIPSVLFLSEKTSFDEKTFLIRSVQKIEKNIDRLCQLCGLSSQVNVFLELEHDCCILDERLCEKKDFIVAKFDVKTFPDSRVEAFASKIEISMKDMGVYWKEKKVPFQYVAHFSTESCVKSIDYDLLWMEWIRVHAKQEGFVCLSDKTVHSSMRRVAWSLITEQGGHLLDPRNHGLVFLTLLTAFIWALHEHGALIWGTVCSWENDQRFEKMGVSFLSQRIDLGEDLTRILQDVMDQDVFDEKALRQYEDRLRCCALAHSIQDENTWFRFDQGCIVTGLLGALGDYSFFICVLNAVIADGLQLILDEMERAVYKNRKVPFEEFFALNLSVLRKHLIEAKAVFCKENKNAIRIENKNWFSSFLDVQSVRCLKGIMDENILNVYYAAFLEGYVTMMQDAVARMLELVNQVGFSSDKKEAVMQVASDLQKMSDQSGDLGWEARLKVFLELGLSKLQWLRSMVEKF